MHILSESDFFFLILNPNSIKPWPHRDHGVIVAGWVGGRPSCPRRCAHTCGVDRAAVQAVHAGRGDFFSDHLSRHAPTVCAYRSDRTSACASYASGGMAFLGRGQATKPKPGRVRPPRWRMRSHRLASARSRWPAACLHDVVLPRERDGPTRARKDQQRPRHATDRTGTLRQSLPARR